VLPVFAILGYILWKYREGNTRAKYSPEQEGSRLAETIWWMVPTVLLVILSIVTWRSTYALDPYKPLPSKNGTLHIQVVAMDWKWLFIYPDQGVASVNEAAIPVNQPVDFELTSDTVMSSFWAPALGGQMYAMPGMATHLNLEASKLGSYNGSAANISGKGFAGMKFVLKALPAGEYDQWLRSASRGPSLDDASYATLSRPSENNKVTYYKLADSGLYDTIMMKYMMPMQPTTTPGGTH
jgi:cytochrome o ubiquinol oxidase subunit II